MHIDPLAGGLAAAAALLLAYYKAKLMLHLAIYGSIISVLGGTYFQLAHNQEMSDVDPSQLLRLLVAVIVEIINHIPNWIDLLSQFRI